MMNLFLQYYSTSTLIVILIKKMDLNLLKLKFTTWMGVITLMKVQRHGKKMELDLFNELDLMEWQHTHLLTLEKKLE
ncbi:MAG: hypothetical protein DSZ21_02860 [Tenericutes bacterium]|nr:MAG: hypothetical protein DSZ21_02860 [Mycoplasmatota bacterium]